MAPRLCLVCGKDLSARRHRSTLYCHHPCGGIANMRNGAGAARAAVAREVKSGRLKPAKECTCVDCGKQARDYDHRDYNKPLEVQPVCRPCNKRRGPAKAVGEGLYTEKQAKFVTPNWRAPLPTPEPATTTEGA